MRVGGCAGGRVGSLFGRAGGMGGGVLSPPWAGGDGRRENSHHTLLLMGAEVALRWAVVFQSLRSGSRFRSCFAAGSFRVFIPSRWFLVSLELLGFPNKVLVSKKWSLFSASACVECARVRA